MAVVDRLGRRPLMLFGCCGIGVSHLLAGMAYRLGLRGTPVLVLTLCAIGCYAMTLDPLTWVLIAEIFPNRLPSLGNADTFFTYGVICLLGAVFVLLCVPETKGRTLEEIEAQTLRT